MSGKGRTRGPVVDVGGAGPVEKKAKLEQTTLETTTVIKQEPVGPLPCIFARLQMAKSKGSGSSGSSSIDGVVGDDRALVPAVAGAQSLVPAAQSPVPAIGVSQTAVKPQVQAEVSPREQEAVSHGNGLGKSILHKWRYREQSLPPALAKRWADIQETTKRGDPIRHEFMTAVASCRNGKYDTNPTLASYVTVEKVHTETDDTKWISWKKFVDNEGEESARHMVDNKTILFRDHKNQRHGCADSLPFPKNQQFKYIEEGSSTGTKVAEGGTLKASVALAAHEAGVFQEHATSIRDGLGMDSRGSVANSLAAALPAPTENITVNLDVLLKTIAKAHPEFDKKQRGWQVFRTKSSGSKHCAGSVVETEFVKGNHGLH